MDILDISELLIPLFQIFRVDSNLTTQVNSEDRKDLKFGVKIFISSMKKKALYEALETSKFHLLICGRDCAEIKSLMAELFSPSIRR